MSNREHGFSFEITDILDMLGVRYPSAQVFDIQCPFCDQKNSKHLHVLVREGVWNCIKCGSGGGMLDLLQFMRGTNESRKEALEEIEKYVSNGCKVKTPTTKPSALVKDNAQKAVDYSGMYKIASIEKRHAAYSVLLNYLDLKSEHERNLRERGLENVSEYRSAPNYTQTRRLTTKVDLSGVPGFYYHDGYWRFRMEKSGILIPVRDVEGRIQGLQVRRDNGAAQKYRWVSTGATRFASMKGTRSECFCHFIGDPNARRVYITEGPIKANVIHAYTGWTVVAVPGVSSLKNLVKMLKNLPNLTEARIVFDMDIVKKREVCKGAKKIRDLLERELNIKGVIYGWDREVKGLDDYLHMRYTKKRA